MEHTVEAEGICPEVFSFTLEDGVLRGVNFQGGCSGNLQGLSRLVEGRDAREVVKILSGISCGENPTSCPNELAKALARALEKEAG
ncbi:MAG: TIGR03905 family TSCPD domain-containing protein [Deltaproteobacteria bacterium]|jgi:uncharacterized protein (TIGR03905 family)|nr:TIGR03905 family TSCPD domain-containing protein [Deltaproteobacteria bacterium]